MTNIVVTGGHGTLGVALRGYLPDAKYLGRLECDVRRPLKLAVYEPDVVIHAAALTDHQHPNAAEIIETNIVGTANVAQWCRSVGVKFVYLSTHYVYPGTAGFYAEHDATNPIGTYAWSKLAGEQWAMLPDRWLIVRGSWYDHETRIRHWVANGAYMDAWCSREHVTDAAKKIAKLVTLDATGLFNIGGKRRTFYEICQAEGHDAPMRSREAPSDAPYQFPLDTSVNTDKYDALVRAAHTL